MKAWVEWSRRLNVSTINSKPWALALNIGWEYVHIWLNGIQVSRCQQMRQFDPWFYRSHVLWHQVEWFSNTFGPLMNKLSLHMVKKGMDNELFLNWNLNVMGIVHPQSNFLDYRANFNQRITRQMIYGIGLISWLSLRVNVWQWSTYK